VAISKPDGAGLVRVCCTVCDDAADVPAKADKLHELLCMCGVRLPGGVALRCAANPERGPAMPQAFITVAVEGSL
jgi:hypothetical protein